MFLNLRSEKFSLDLKGFFTVMYHDVPQLVREFLIYMETIKGRSKNTVNGYYVDLRTFFRFLKLHRNLVPADIPFTEITVDDLTIDFIRTITLSDVYEFLLYISSGRSNQAKTRARKVSCLRVFFKYLTNNLGLLKENPVENLESPGIKKTLPKYLTLENCYELLNHIDGPYRERDYCIITLFLNCGMRLSELVGINFSDIKENVLLLRGKGNKERIVYLNDACLSSLEDYIKVRNEQFGHIQSPDKNALFLSRNGKRISRRRVEELVSDALNKAGLSGYSVHKLRHTAATLMYQHGNVDVRVLQEILGHTNLGTTQIYTHISNDQMENASQSNPLANVKMKQQCKK